MVRARRLLGHHVQQHVVLGRVAVGVGGHEVAVGVDEIGVDLGIVAGTVLGRADGALPEGNIDEAHPVAVDGDGSGHRNLGGHFLVKTRLVVVHRIGHRLRRGRVVHMARQVGEGVDAIGIGGLGALGVRGHAVLGEAHGRILVVGIPVVGPRGIARPSGVVGHLEGTVGLLGRGDGVALEHYLTAALQLLAGEGLVGRGGRVISHRPVVEAVVILVVPDEAGDGLARRLDLAHVAGLDRLGAGDVHRGALSLARDGHGLGLGIEDPVVGFHALAHALTGRQGHVGVGVRVGELALVVHGEIGGLLGQDDLAVVVAGRLQSGGAVHIGAIDRRDARGGRGIVGRIGLAAHAAGDDHAAGHAGAVGQRRVGVGDDGLRVVHRGLHGGGHGAVRLGGIVVVAGEHPLVGGAVGQIRVLLAVQVGQLHAVARQVVLVVVGDVHRGQVLYEPLALVVGRHGQRAVHAIHRRQRRLVGGVAVVDDGLKSLAGGATVLVGGVGVGAEGGVAHPLALAGDGIRRLGGGLPVPLGQVDGLARQAGLAGVLHAVVAGGVVVGAVGGLDARVVPHAAREARARNLHETRLAAGLGEHRARHVVAHAVVDLFVLVGGRIGESAVVAVLVGVAAAGGHDDVAVGAPQALLALGDLIAVVGAVLVVGVLIVLAEGRLAVERVVEVLLHHLDDAVAIGIRAEGVVVGALQRRASGGDGGQVAQRLVADVHAHMQARQREVGGHLGKRDAVRRHEQLVQGDLVGLQSIGSVVGLQDAQARRGHGVVALALGFGVAGQIHEARQLLELVDAGIGSRHGIRAREGGAHVGHVARVGVAGGLGGCGLGGLLGRGLHVDPRAVLGGGRGAVRLTGQNVGVAGGRGLLVHDEVGRIGLESLDELGVGHPEPLGDGQRVAREHFLAGVQDAVEVVVAPDLAGNRGPAVLAEAGVHAHLVAADRPVVVDGLVDGLARRVARRHLSAGGGTGQRVGVGGRLAVAGGLGQLGQAGLVHIVLGLGAAGRSAGRGGAGAGGGVARGLLVAFGRLGGGTGGQDDLAVHGGLHGLAGAVDHLHGELVEAHRVVAVGVVGEVLLVGAGGGQGAHGLGIQGVVGLIGLQQGRRQAGDGLAVVGVHRAAQHLDGVAGQVLGRRRAQRALHAFHALDAVGLVGLHGLHAGHAGLDIAGRQAVEQVVAGHLDLLLGGATVAIICGLELVAVGQQVDAHAVQVGGVGDDGGKAVGVGRVVHGVDHLNFLGVVALAHGLGFVGDLVLGHGVAVVAEVRVQQPLVVLVVPLLQDDALAGVALIGGGDVRRRIVGAVARALERLVSRLKLVGRGGMVERAVVVGVVEHPSGDLLLHGHAQAGVVAGAVGAAGQVVGEHRMELGGLGALDLQRRAGGVQLGHRVGGEHGCRRGLAVAGVAAVAVGGRRLQLVVGIRVVRVQGLALVHRLRVGGLHVQKHRVLHGVGRIGGAAHEVAVGVDQIGIGEPCLGGLHVGVALEVLGGAPVAVPPVGVGHADAVAEHDALLRRPLGAVGHNVAVRVEGQPPLALQVVEDVGAVLGRDGVVGRLGRLGLLVALGEGRRAGGGDARGHHGAVGVVAGKANRRIGGVGRVGVLGRPGGIDRPAAGDHGGVLGVQRLGQSEGALQRQLDARHRVVGRSIAVAHRKRAVHAVVVGVVEHHAGDLLGGRLNLAGIAAGHFLDRLAGDRIGDLHQLLGNFAGVGIFNLAQLLLGLVGEPVVGDVAVLRDEQIAFGRARTIDGLLHHIGDGDGHLGGLQVDGRRGLVDIAVLGVARALGQDDVAGVGAGAVVGGAVERDDGILGRDGDAVEHRLHVGVGVGIQLGPGQRVALHLLGQRLVEAREQPRLVVGQGGLVGARVVQLAHFHAVARQVVGAVLGGVGGRQVVEGVDALRGLVGHLLLADDVLGHRVEDVLHPATRVGRLGGDDARGVAGIVEHVPGARRARHQGVVEHRLAVAVDGLLAGGLVHDGLVLLLARQLVGAEGEVAHPEAGAVGGGLEGLGLDGGRGHAGRGGLGGQRALVGGIELALGGEGGQLGVHGEAEALVGGLALVGLDDAVALVDVQVRQRQVVPLGEVHHLVGQARLAVVLDAVVGALAGRGIACVLVGLVERVVPHLAGDRRAGHGKQARIPVVQTGRVAQVVDGVRRAEVHLAGAVVLLGLVLLLLLQVVAVVGLVLGVLVVELVVHRKRRVVVGQGLLVVALQPVVDRLVAGEREGVLALMGAALAGLLFREVRTGRRGLVAVVVGAVQLKVLRVVAVVGGLVDEERLLLGAARDDDAFLVVGLGVHVGGHVVLRDGNELLVDVVVAEAERGVPLAQEVVPVGRPGLAGLLAGALALDRGRLGLVRHLDLVVELLLGILRVAGVGVLDVGVALGLVGVEVVVDAVEVGVVPRRRAQLVRRRRHGGLGVGLQHLAAVGHVGPQAVQGRLHRVGVGIAVHGHPAQGDELGVNVGEVAVGVVALLAVDLVVRGLDEVRPADARGGRVLVAAPNRVQVGDGAVDHQVHRVARKPRLQGLAALRVGVVGVVRLDVRVDQVVLGAEARKARARRLAHHGARSRGRKQPGGGEVRGEGDAAEREARTFDGGLGGQVGHAGVIAHGGGGRALAHDLDGAALVGLAVDELGGGKHRGLVQRQHRHELVQIALDLVADGVRLDVAFLAAGDDGVVRDGLHRAQVVARRHGHRLAGQQGVRPEGDDLVAIAVGALDSRAAEAAGGAGGADGIALGERIGDGDRLGLVRLVAVGGREGHVHRGLDVELLEGQKLVGRVRVVAVGHGHAGLVVARHGVHADGGEHDVGVLEGAGLHLAALLVQVVGERGGVLVVGAVDVLGAVEQLVVARGGGVRVGHGTALNLDVHLLVAVHHLHVARGLGVGRSRLVHAVGNLDVVLGRVLKGALAGVRLAQHGGGHGLGHGVGIRVDGLARRLAVLGEEGVAHGNGVVLVERVQVVLIDAQAVAGQTLGLVVVVNAGALIARVDDVGGHVAEQVGARGGRIARVGLAQRLARVQLPSVLFGVLHDPLHDGGLVAVGVEDRLAERVHLPGRIAIGVCGLLVLHRGGDRRVVPGLHLHAHTAVLGALAHAGLVVLLDAVVVGILPDVVAQIALGAVDVAQGQLILARVAHPLVAGIVVDGLELDGVGVVGLAVLVAVGLAVGGERELGRAAVGRVQRVAAVVQPDERQVGHERVGAGRAGHVAQVVVGHEHVGAVVVEAVALVGRRIVGPGVQRRLDEAVGHGLRGADDVGLARLQTEAEEAGLVGDHRGDVAVGIGGDVLDGAVLVLVDVHADALEALLVDLGGAGHLGLGAARAHGDGVEQRVDVLVVLRRAVGQDVVAVGDALEGDALGDAQLQRGHLLVVGLMHRIQGAVAHLGLVVGHRLHLEGSRGDHERRVHAVGMVGLDALDGEILVVLLHVQVRVTDGLRRRRVVVVLLREGEAQTVAHLLEARGGLQVGEDVVAGVAVVVGLGVADVRRTGVGVDVVAPGVEVLLARAGVADDPAVLEAGLGVVHELDDLAVAVDGVAVLVEELDLDVVDAGILHLGVVVEVLQAGGAVGVLRVVEGATNLLGHRGAVAHQALALLVDLQPVLVAVAALAVGNRLAGAHEGHGVVDDLAVLVGLHAADELAAVGRGLVGGAAVVAERHVVLGRAGPVRIEPDVVAQVSALVGRVDEGARAHVLAEVHAGGVAGLGLVHARDEGVPLQRGAQKVRLVQRLLAILHDHAGIR